MPPSQTPPTPELLSGPKKKEPVGPLVGIIIIIAVVALGGLYFWGAQLNREQQEQPLPFIPPESGASLNP